jgi:heptosyltransferase-2
MKPYVHRVLEGTRWLDQVVFYDNKSSDRQRSSWAVARQLRRLRPDVAIYLCSSLKPALIGWWSGARERVGYARNGRAPFLTNRLWPPRRGRDEVPRSTVDFFLDLAYAVGCPVEERRLELAVSPADHRGAEAVWQNLGLDACRQVVMLNFGAAGGKARLWPEAYFVELAQALVRDPQRAVLLLCGPKEREPALRLEQQLAHPRIRSMANQDLGLGVSKACLLRGQVLVTTDSGPRHIAAAFRVPTILLAGPVDPRATWNYNPRETAVHTNLPCQPCGRHDCALGHIACMRDLAPQAVYRAILEVLAQNQRQAA